MASNQGTVSAAWARGKSFASGALRTDGQTLWSYNAVIGFTSGAEKIALDCHASVTTARHVNGAKEVADRTEPCIAHHGCRERARKAGTWTPPEA